jgi:hypothetical protein
MTLENISYKKIKNNKLKYFHIVVPPVFCSIPLVQNIREIIKFKRPTILLLNFLDDARAF